MKFKEFTIHHFTGYVQNNYIVEYKDRILLIDGASRPDTGPIAEFIVNKLHRDLRELKLVAVTHCHPDHAGAAGYFRKNFGTAIAAPFDIDDWYSGICGSMQHISDMLQSRFMARKLQADHRMLYYNKKVAPEYKLHNMSPLPMFDDWQAIHAPGHTSHNIYLYNEKHGLLYISDTIIDSRGKFLPPVPVLFPEQMKQSLLKIKSIRPKYLLLAHGPRPFYEYDEKMVDDTIRKIDGGSPRYIRMFYFISKFTSQYRKNKESSS